MRTATFASLVLGLALLAGCPAPLAPEGGAGGVRGGTEASCSKPLPVEQAALASARAAALPESLLALAIRLPLERLRQEIERRVPVELATGGQNVGRLGRLSYSVRREAVALRLEAGKLLVDIPVSGYAEVCVPVGSLCPRVSGCSPALVMTAAIPLALDERYAFGQSEVSVRITRGCVIAGIDATARFSGAASQQAAAAGRRIDQSLPSLRPEIEAAWAGLGQPMPLGSGACLLGTPRRLVQAPPSIVGNELEFHVGVAATFRTEPSCPASPGLGAVSAPLPAPERVESLDRVSDVALGTLRPWPELQAELDRSIALRASGPDGQRAPDASSAPLGPQADPPAGLASLSVAELRAVAGSEGPLVASRIALAGERCGEVWLTAEARSVSTQATVILAKVSVAAGQPGRTAALAGLGLERWLGARGAFAPAPPLGPSALDAIRQTLERAVRQRAKDATVTASGVRSALERALVAPGGLLWLERVRAELGIDVR